MAYKIFQNYGYNDEIFHGEYEHLGVAVQEMNTLADDLEQSGTDVAQIFEVATHRLDGEYVVHSRRDVEVDY